MTTRTCAFMLIGVLLCMAAVGVVPAAAESPYAQWSRGPSTDPSYFPIAVWAQAPRSARVAAYSAAGFNLYVGISWDETPAGMDRLRNAGMRIMLPQDGFGLSLIDDPILAGWIQQDEPDNAQSRPGGGYYTPVAPLPTTTWSDYPGTDILTRYRAMQAVDPTRPIYLNLGQGVAWAYPGRGTRKSHPEDYPEYAQGCDIVSYDIYPGASGRTETAGKLWMVAEGVDRLVAASRPGQPVWNCIETTNISGDGQATPAEVKAEVWMSLIHGSMGINYFAHVIGPNFDEQGLLHDPVMLAAVTDINWEIHALAPVLNSPTIEGDLSVTSSRYTVPIDTMVKKHNGHTYIFSVAMRNAATTGGYFGATLPPVAVAEVIGEDREIPVYGGFFNDDFDGFGVHLYRIKSRYPGDTDGDGDVDMDDFVILKQNFLTAADATWEQGDLDGDGDVDLDDFVILKQNFGVDTTP